MERPDASRRRVLALSFRSGGMVLFIHWRGGAERGAGTHHGRADGHGAGRFLFAKFYLRNWPRRDWQVSWSSSATTYGVDFANRRSQQPGEGQHINQTRAELSRARGARRPSAVGQRSDPRSDRPAGAACWPPSPIPSREILFRGKMMLMLLLRLAAAQRRGQR